MYEMLQRCIQDNLLDVHPPFQIDGNFGLPEAVLECLVQCHGGRTELLPCLPARWNTGSVRGMGLRGGITLDMDWREGKITFCRMKALRPGKVTVKYAGRELEAEIKNEFTDITGLFAVL